MRLVYQKRANLSTFKKALFHLAVEKLGCGAEKTEKGLYCKQKVLVLGKMQKIILCLALLFFWQARTFVRRVRYAGYSSSKLRSAKGVAACLWVGAANERWGCSLSEAVLFPCGGKGKFPFPCGENGRFPLPCGGRGGGGAQGRGLAFFPPLGSWLKGVRRTKITSSPIFSMPERGIKRSSLLKKPLPGKTMPSTQPVVKLKVKSHTLPSRAPVSVLTTSFSRSC